MPTQLTWGMLRKLGEGMSDETPVYLEDGNLNCLPALAFRVCTHKDAETIPLLLFEAEEVSAASESRLEALPGPAVVIGFDGAFDFENPPFHSIA